MGGKLSVKRQTLPCPKKVCAAKRGELALRKGQLHKMQV